MDRVYLALWEALQAVSRGLSVAVGWLEQNAVVLVVAFAAIVVPTTWMLYRRWAAQADRRAQEQLETHAWFVVLVACFIFETRMHERYILFALALAPLMWYCGRLERGAAATFIPFQQ